MVANVSFNPYGTTNAAGSFNVDSVGYMQGTAMADPATRFQLAGGVLATTEILPMWGGVAISELVPGTTGSYGPGPYTETSPAAVLGTLVSRATLIGSAGVAASLTGFSVFDQNYSSINFPQSPVQLAGSGMQVNFYRLGSNARIALALNPALTLPGSIITQQLSWDFVNQWVTNYLAAWSAQTITSATYTSSTGVIAVTFGTAPFGAGIGSGANGVYIELSGLTTSAGAAANVNGQFAVTGTGTSGTVVSVQGVAGLGTITINSAVGGIVGGGGALPIKVLDVNIGNSMTVAYSATTGFATWNRSGSCVLVQI